MITTNAFDYINVLDKAADASWLRETAIMNNLANTDTPGYKRQEVDFESSYPDSHLCQCFRCVGQDADGEKMNGLEVIIDVVPTITRVPIIYCLKISYNDI